ncbi:MAG: hypothetical protein AAFR58_06785 [Cyanobacteria bacterium J06627_28]
MPHQVLQTVSEDVPILATAMTYQASNTISPRDELQKVLLIEEQENSFDTIKQALQEQYPQAEINRTKSASLIAREQLPTDIVLSASPGVQSLPHLKEQLQDYEGAFLSLSSLQPISMVMTTIATILSGNNSFDSVRESLPSFDRRWVNLLELKFRRGLSDKAIAAQMGISDRTIRNYWMRIQDALEIQDDPSKDLRVQIQLAAQAAGLLSAA